MFVFGFLFRPFFIFVVRNITEVVDLVVQSSSGFLGLSNGPFQLEGALLLPVLIRTALKTIVVVVQFLSDLGDSKLVIVFGLPESRALFVQFRFGVNDGVLKRCGWRGWSIRRLWWCRYRVGWLIEVRLN